MREIPYDSSCSPRSNYEHLTTVFEGYRAFVLANVYTENFEKPDCPYSPGSAAAFSWKMGVDLAEDETKAR